MKCKSLWQDLVYIYGKPIRASFSDEVIDDFKGSPFTMIYIDRLRNLVREKYEEIRDALDEVASRASSSKRVSHLRAGSP